MNREAAVPIEDLAMTLDWLEGLIALLYQFHEEQRGAAGEDPLVTTLERLIDERGVWEPIRYQRGQGMGWYHLAANVEDLRDRLLARYSDAAL